LIASALTRNTATPTESETTHARFPNLPPQADGTYQTRRHSIPDVVAQEIAMNGIIYIVGLVVVVLAVASFFGFR
jgi:hypothetical protein